MSLVPFLNSIYFIFIFILIVFISYYYYNDSVLNTLYTTLGGRIILLLTILFGSTINIWVGLAILLVIIVLKPKSSKEGITNITPINSINRNRIMNTNTNMNTNMNTTNKVGIDPITISQAIQSKASSTLPIANTSNKEVESFDTYHSTFSHM